MLERRPPRLPFTAALAGLLFAGGCAGALNYLEPAGPRYGGPGEEPAETVDPHVQDGELRIVSFNIQFSLKVSAALELLRNDPELRRADLILLQEMDEPGTRHIAEALGLHWVYYPATRHPKHRRDFGNALLSRWPLEDDAKLILPHQARFGGTQRIAVGATVWVGGEPIRVYSLHLATFAGNGPRARRRQLARVLEDADSYPRVIVGGDFNSASIPGIALPRGYAWPTRGLPATAAGRTIDHILLKGIDATAPIRGGVIRDNRGSSDHRPVWIGIPGRIG